MRSILTPYRPLITALLENVIFIFSFFLLVASLGEILLPGVITARFPLAIFYSLFSLLILFFVFLGEPYKSETSYHLTLSPLEKIILILLLSGITLLMTRAFGLIGAIVHSAFFLFVSYLLTKKEST